MSSANPPGADLQLNITILAPVALLLTSAAMAMGIGAVGVKDWEQFSFTFVLISAFSLYLSWEVYREMRMSGPIALLCPPVLATFVHFFLSYVVPMLAMPLNDKLFVRAAAWMGVEDITPWVNRTLILSAASAGIMWLGYRSSFAANLGRSARAWLERTAWIRRDINPNMPILIGLVGIAISAKLIQISLGVMGYASTEEALIYFAKYRRILDLSSNLMTLSLFLIACLAFDRHAKGRSAPYAWGLLALVFALQVGSGFVSGFKGAVVLPAVVIGVAYVIAYRRIPIAAIFLGIALLGAAYAVIEPFRAARNSTRDFESTSLASIVDTMMGASTSDQGRPRRETESIAERVLLRSELISFTSISINMKETKDFINEDTPNFLAAIVFAPINAIIPRAIWPEKPIFQMGRWYAVTALGQSPLMNNSVNMGPISYFYFIGGWIACIIGFGIIGVLMRILWTALPPLGIGGWIVYLSVLESFVVIYGEIGPALAGVLQLIPLSIWAQSVILKK